MGSSIVPSRRRRISIIPISPAAIRTSIRFGTALRGAGQWDVDNDGDGVPDSVWVDLGMPVRSTSRRPLVQAAVRHPLHRSRRPAERQRPRLPGADRHDYPDYGASTPLPASRVRRRHSRTALPRGLGYGPAEIDLRACSALAVGPQLLTDRYPASSTSAWPGGAAGHLMSLNKWFLYGAYGSELLAQLPAWRTTAAPTARRPTWRASAAIGIDGAAGRSTATWDKL